MKLTRLTRTGALALAALAAAVLGASSASARTVAAPLYDTVLHAPRAADPGAVRPDTGGFSTVSAGTWSNSPSASDLSGYGFPANDPVYLGCYEFGGAAGPYGNTLWYWAGDNSGVNGWINDHYLNTPGTAANPQPQTGECEPASSGNPFSPPPYTLQFNAVGSAAWSNSPSASDLSGYGFGNGNPIDLQCWEYGGPDGPYGNTLWYWAQDPANNTYGWISDHNLTTPGTAAHPQPQGWECDPAYVI